MQLAIDTSSDIASIALAESGQVTAELTWRSAQNHTVELLPNLGHLLGKAGISSVDCVFVAIGPGSFNGLRVGMSTAKGLAFSLGIPIIGIGTLAVEAYQHAELGLPVRPISRAGRGEIATALYQLTGEDWRQLEPEHLTTVDSVCQQVVAPTVFCGEFVASVASQLRACLVERAVIPPLASRLRRAGFLAELGERRRAAGDFDNLAALQPLYLRRPPITEPKRSLRTMPR